MHSELILTNDGSHTILIPQLDVTFHSRHGAVQESLHVFIDAGLHYTWTQEEGNRATTTIFELGLGTGLNALLTCAEAVKQQRRVVYTAIEPFPLADGITDALNYNDPAGYLERIHKAPWNQLTEINEYFSIEKSTLKFEQAGGSYQLVYFDAFGPEVQPELWSVNSFLKLFDMMKPGAVLTTYCSKSEVRRNMTAAGLKVIKIQGPWGKREMVRAMRPVHRL
jgi:tRNA U34 5-methylaminomethyl-2-thiouridine-forming methyltransferase MnmC